MTNIFELQHQEESIIHWLIRGSFKDMQDRFSFLKKLTAIYFWLRGRWIIQSHSSGGTVDYQKLNINVFYTGSTPTWRNAAAFNASKPNNHLCLSWVIPFACSNGSHKFFGELQATFEIRVFLYAAGSINNKHEVKSTIRVQVDGSSAEI